MTRFRSRFSSLSGSRHAPAVNMQGFSHSAVVEAEKILAGSSEWFDFEGGRLVDLNPDESPESQQGLQRDVDSLLGAGTNAKEIRSYIAEKKVHRRKGLAQLERDQQSLDTQLLKALTGYLDTYWAANSDTATPMDINREVERLKREEPEIRELAQQIEALKAQRPNLINETETSPSLKAFATYLAKKHIEVATAEHALAFLKRQGEQFQDFLNEETKHGGGTFADLLEEPSNLSGEKSRIIAATLGLLANLARESLDGPLSQHLQVHLYRRYEPRVIEEFQTISIANGFSDDYDYALKWKSPFYRSPGERLAIRVRDDDPDKEAEPDLRDENHTPGDIVESNLDIMKAYYDRLKIFTGERGELLRTQLLSERNPHRTGEEEVDPYYDSGGEADWLINRVPAKIVKSMVQCGVSIRKYAEDEGIDLSRWSNRYPDMLQIIEQDDLAQGLLHHHSTGITLGDNVPQVVQGPWLELAGEAEVTLSPELESLVQARYRSGRSQA